jgi:hypothetical protein
MRRPEQFILWLGISVAVTLSSSVTGIAQEVGFVDLTQIVARTELRQPAPRNGEVSERRGGTGVSHDCALFPNARKDAGALRTTLVWLDRSEYEVGDHEKFEVRIENVGSAPIKFPFSPHLSDLQPADASQKFGYSVVIVKLWIGGARWDTNSGDGLALYGANQHHGTMLTIQPGEWVRIIGIGKITLPEEVVGLIRDGDVVSHANAEVSIYQAEMLLSPSASAKASLGVCLSQSQGPSVAMKLDLPN